MPTLDSKKFSNIMYEEGNEILYFSEDIGTSFSFDVTKDLTSNEASMKIVASFLDDTDALVAKAHLYLKEVLLDEQSEYHDTVKFFLSFHKDEMDVETLRKMLGVSEVENLSLLEMIDFLKIQRLGSLIDEYLNEQVFVMDLCFNPDVTDELMVIYFNLEKDIVLVTHES